MKKIMFILFVLAINISCYSAEYLIRDGYSILANQTSSKLDPLCFYEKSNGSKSMYGLYRATNSKLEVVTNAIYEDLYLTAADSEYPVIAVKRNGKWGFVCVSMYGKLHCSVLGKEVVPCIYDKVDFETLEQPFKNGVGIVYLNGKQITLTL